MALALPSPFNLTLYAAPSREQPGDGPELELGQAVMQTVTLRPGIQPPPFSMSFEQLQVKLDAHRRIYFESDGAFLWTGSDTATGDLWQLAGMLYDAADRLQRIELRGTCPLAIWQQWLTMLDWPTQPLMIQLLEHGAMVTPAEFEKLWQV